MNTPGSPDINSLQVCVTWNLSGSSPQIDLLNQSTGGNLANVVYAFIIKSPSQTVMLDGNVADPNISGIWSEWTFYSQNPDPSMSPPPTNYGVAPWPRPFGQIEWSGSPYTIEVFAKDSFGNIFSYVISQEVCRPAGNTNLSINTYGKGIVNINMNCNSAQAFFENISNTSYKGLAGTQESSILKVLYPDDQTGSAPQPFIVPNFSTALVPITFDSENYEFVYTAVYKYDFPNCSSVLIKYYTKQRFTVNCNIDLCPLVCEYLKLIQQSETGNCENLQEINEKLLLINGKMNLAILAKEQPLCGIDLPALIEEIKLIGGFDCDCCSPSGIQPYNGTTLAGYNFIVRSSCGDISGYYEVVGNNITLVLADKSYVFKMCPDVPTSAFTVTPSTSGCTRTYCLNVNMNTLANDILLTISTNNGLVNLFNTIVNNGGSGAGNLIVDGKCIFKQTSVCDYAFGMVNIPASPVNAILTGIYVNGSFVGLNFAFNQSTLTALQTYLNGLGFGTFSVTNVGGTVTITSTNNSSGLSGVMTYVVSSVTQFSSYSINCTGFVELSANDVVQNIINYLCALNDSQLVTSQAYDICYLDPISLQSKIVTVAAGTPENTLIAQLLDRNCDTINYVSGLGRVDCAGIQEVFPHSAATMQLNDYFLGTKAGACAQINPVEAGIRIMEMGLQDAAFMATFCNLVTACAQGLFCAPYTILQLSVVGGSPANTIDIVVTFVHPDAVSDTLYYARTDNTSTPVYTTITGLTPGQSPYTIAGLPDGEYSIGMRPIYADGRACGGIFISTGLPSRGFNSFSAYFDGTNIIVSYNAPVAMPKLRVNVNLPNGGVVSSIHTNTGVDIPIAPPAGVFGNYTITLTAVYNETTGYLGQTTAPAIVNVTEPFNSSFVNNTTNDLEPVSITSSTETETTVQFNVPSVAGGGGIVNFFLANNTYKTIVVSYPTGKVGVAYLNTISGTYFAEIDNHVATFKDVVVSGGIAVTAVDESP